MKSYWNRQRSRSNSLRVAALFRQALAGAICVAFVGCVQKMADQPREDFFAVSEFFPNGQAARMPVAGTVPRGMSEDSQLLTGKRDGKPLEELPLELTATLLERGHGRFEIYCTPCHGRVGNGDGMVVKRGFPAPPTYHSQRLRDVPIGHIFDVVTNGLGRMPRFSDRIVAGDRWAIAAYVRALQLSQHAELKDLPEAERQKLEGAAP
jgi:mono/diheme cytochrome c family protein